MNQDVVRKIIRSLHTKQISRNDKGDFFDIHNSHLCLGAKRTKELKFPGFFEFEGWFRFFDVEEVGERTKMLGSFQQAVRSDNEARLRTLNSAVSDILLEPNDELIEAVGCAPTNLHIISASPSFIATLETLMRKKEAELVGQIEPLVQRNLKFLRSVSILQVQKELVASIYRELVQAPRMAG